MKQPNMFIILRISVNVIFRSQCISVKLVGSVWGFLRITDGHSSLPQPISLICVMLCGLGQKESFFSALFLSPNGENFDLLCIFQVL